MTKLLKHAVLALALALGTSTFAHAESVAIANGGFGAIIQEILNWLFGSSSGHNNNNQTKNNAPEIDPGLAMSGFILLGGTLTVVRSRRRN